MPANEVARAVADYAAALCRAESNRPATLAKALGLDAGSGARTFSEFVLPAPAGLRLLRFVVGADDELVRFAELRPDEPLPLADLVQLLGAAEPVGGSPHRPMPAVMFGDVRVPGAPQTCTVLADLTNDTDAVTSVTLHPHPIRG